jgi:hypothetical protein
MSYFSRRILFALTASILLLAVPGGKARAQFGNSWINFSNTYYKFKITEEGIFRIGKSQLDAIGMGGATGNQFAIFREGQEVPIYTSTTGAFGGSDFIEFYATKADGKIDKQLYPDPNFQPNDEVNLISDTAYYFITFDNSVHQRMQLTATTIPFPAPAPAPYCWSVAYPTYSIRTAWNPGMSHTNSDYFYSSDYDKSEGYSYLFGANNNLLFIPTPDPYYSGPASIYSVVWAEHTVNTATTPSHVTMNVGGSTLFDTTLSATFASIKKNISFPTTLLSGNSTTVGFNDVYQYTVQKATLTYPKGYNFPGLSQVGFQVPASERYLEISNFNGGTAPRLYDVTNNKIYTGVVSGSTIKFYLETSALQRKMFLVNSGSITNMTNFTPIQFRNYEAAANQGDYIILSNKSYITAAPNYVNDFKTYRSSVAGGSHQVVIVDVAELYDQFGYGYDYHPISIKNFIAYANASWTPKPKFMFIVGKGVSYRNYNDYKASPATYPYTSVVPTWGEPGADNLFSSFNNDQKPILATGRLSAWNNQEVGDYLKKVKDYEEAIRPLPVPTVAHEFWKKTVMHVAGSSDIGLQNTLLAALNDCKTIIEDTLVGAIVTTVKKNTTDPVDQQSNSVIDSFMSHGLKYISFYGHGSSSGFDYNLNSPDNYHSTPRFPIFSAFACEVAHIFSLVTSKSVGERYIASVDGGSIIMIAGNNEGWTGTLPGYMSNLYKSWTFRDYGKTLGEQYQNNINFLQSSPLYSDDFMDIHTQCILYQGDPAIISYSPDKRDYVIEEPGLSSLPTNVTTALDSFDIRATVYSLGKSERDSVWVRLQHTVQGSTTVLYADSILLTHLLSVDTVKFRVPLNGSTDIGLNNYTVKIDCNEKYDELSEENNQATLQIFIYSENLQPLYPKEYAIVHEQGVTLKASTLNAFAPLRRYKVEIDTTEEFNSILKQSTEITSTGGLIKWKPTLNYVDSTVYYWRATPDTLINGKYNWAGSSFIYLQKGSDGWNQSHYYQYKDDEPYNALNLLGTNRKWRFDSLANILKVEDKVIDLTVGNFQDVRQSINDVIFDNGGCVYEGSIQFVVIDSTTGIPWRNYFNGAVGMYGSYGACGSNPVKQMFEFSLTTRESRNNARLFIQNIVPNGSYIMVKNLIMHQYWNKITADTMKADEQFYGTGNTLYHALKNIGCDVIDQFTSERVFAFFRKKGDNTFPVTQSISANNLDKIEFLATFHSFPDTGSVQSPLIGPALSWNSLKWRNSSNDNAPQNDSGYVAVYGMHGQQETLLFSGYSRDTSLASISAAYYPYLRLKWYSVDNVTRTSPQLDFWRVLYSPVPEAALNANAHYEFIDSLSEGQQGKLNIAIENLTPIPMDSMLVSYKVIDANSVKHPLGERRFKKLIGNDTLIANFDFDISAYHGKSFIYIEANPNNDQPEQYHPNNIGYIPIYNTADQLNPLLDVTFDGVHILDKDIVSAKPMIKVLLRDENKFLPLNDTALMKVQLVYPNTTTPVDVPMDGTICKFFPAQIVNGHKNEARVEFKPNLPQDGVYKLIVSGKDKVGNVAGNALTYDVSFTVENKPSITNVLNYPNPFSTATQFVFTMTGSEIPSQFKIQIISVTGKVVREIKKNELGNLHIGRNMTDYRWDGKDEFGQMLGNGVYLYRVVTSIRGEGIEQRKNTTVEKYFKNGYGHLSIMR